MKLSEKHLNCLILKLRCRCCKKRFGFTIPTFGEIIDVWYWILTWVQLSIPVGGINTPFASSPSCAVRKRDRLQYPVPESDPRLDSTDGGRFRLSDLGLIIAAQQFKHAQRHRTVMVGIEVNMTL